MFRNLFSLLTVILFAGSTIAQNNDNLYFVFLNTNPDRELLSDEDSETLQAAHLQNIDKLAVEGKLMAAGPFEGGGGMLILQAESLDQANSFLQTDPAVQANRFNIEVHPFALAHGNMCGAKEPYEMVTYQMVSFSNNAADSEQEQQLSHDTRIFMAELSAKKQNIIAQGYFNKLSEGIVILQVKDAGEAEKIFKKHPSVKSGKMTYQVKSLRIAKGTFCE